MKTLIQFFRWVEGENPSDPYGKAVSANSPLSPVATLALNTALDLVMLRTGPAGLNQNLKAHTEAVRDLSLAICQALEAMHEAVPEAERPTVPWYGGEPTSLRDVTGLMAEQNRLMRDIYRDQMAHMYETLVLPEPAPPKSDAQKIAANPTGSPFRPQLLELYREIGRRRASVYGTEPSDMQRWIVTTDGLKMLRAEPRRETGLLIYGTMQAAKTQRLALHSRCKGVFSLVHTVVTNRHDADKQRGLTVDFVLKDKSVYELAPDLQLYLERDVIQPLLGVGANPRPQ